MFFLRTLIEDDELQLLDILPKINIQFRFCEKRDLHLMIFLFSVELEKYIII